MKKIIIGGAIALSVIGVGAFIVVNNNDTKIEKVKETYTESRKRLDDAKEIKITKDLISVGKSYEIEVDDESFGDLDGKAIRLTGDVLTLTNDSDVIISSEEQIKRWGVKLNRLAEVKDNNNNVTGYIGEEKLNDLLKIGYNFHFYHKKKRVPPLQALLRGRGFKIKIKKKLDI